MASSVSIPAKCDRCGSEGGVLQVKMPLVDENEVWMNGEADLCQNCLNSYIKVMTKWWDDLPI